MVYCCFSLKGDWIFSRVLFDMSAWKFAIPTQQVREVSPVWDSCGGSIRVIRLFTCFKYVYRTEMHIEGHL